MRARRVAGVGMLLGSAWVGALTMAPRMERDRRLETIRHWAGAMARCLNVTVVARGTPLPRHCPLLLVANHVSWLDVCALGSVEGMLFVAKAEVAGWPVMGRIASGFGNFFHPRGNLRPASRIKSPALLRQVGALSSFPRVPPVTATN
jgi:1-acyl-sn-glycerol-3-phosphate acyltransferase